MPVRCIVRGRLLNTDDRPVESVTVHGYDRDLRGEQLLGRAVTDAGGGFEIAYTDEQFRRAEKGRADLLLRVFDPDDVPLVIRRLEVNGEGQDDPEAPVHNVPAECEVRLLVERPARGDLSEYERHLADAAPILEGLAWHELSREDVAFIAGDLGLDRERAPQIEWLRAAARLERRTDLPAEAFYGWARTGLPGDWDELPRAGTDERHARLLDGILATLIETPDQLLLDHLLRATDERIVPAWMRDRAEEAVRALRRRGLAAREIRARLIDERTGQPLAGYSVTIADADADLAPADLALTDAQGDFTFTAYAPRAGEPAGARTFEFAIDVPGAERPAVVRHAVELDREEPLRLGVALPVVPAPSLAELRDAGQIDLPNELLAHLADVHNARTFADVRRLGGLAALDGPGGADPAAVRRLEALADLDRVSADVSANARLVEQGYDSVVRVAGAGREPFVRIARELLGDYRAAEMYLRARVESQFLNGVLSGALADRANGVPVATEVRAAAEVLSQPCGCADCDAAVSPRAYLADLLRYTIQHVSHNGQPIDAATLAATLHQPLDELPDSCEASEQLVRAIRLDVEILRGFLRATPPDAAHGQVLAERERQHLLAAYTTLLNRIGTSFEEIRLAMGTDEAQRTALAERLGIDLTPGLSPTDDELGQLLLDPGAAPSGNLALSGPRLEALFGLADTARDPLSQATKLGDQDGQLKRWNLDGVRWRENTSEEGSVFVGLAHDPVAGAYRIELFRDGARAELVASAEATSADATVALLPANDGDLRGAAHFAHIADTAAIEIVAVPRLLAWRLRLLRRQWREEDRPPDPYSARALPAIDPDLIGPADIRHARMGQPVFDLWQARRAQVDALLASTRDAREANAGDGDGGVGQLLALTLGMTAAELRAIAADLTQTTDAATRRAAEDAIVGMGLTPSAFARLLGLLETAPALEATGWDEVYDILTQASKVAQFPTWVAEEQVADIALGPEEFWIAPDQPTPRRWLAEAEQRQLWQDALRRRSQPPVIDPDAVPAGYLADALTGPARTLWKARADGIVGVIAGAAAGLDAVRQANGDELAYFDRAVEAALGEPVARLRDLDAQRRRGESTEAALARLTLSESAFGALLRIRELLAGGERVLDAEWQSAFSILAQVWKERRHARWRDEEARDGITLSQDHFRPPPPPDDPLQPVDEPLPAWRATWRARQDWRDRLSGRIAAEQSVVAGLADAVGAAEEACLPGLRDALVAAAATGGETFAEAAARLAARLLIDTRAAGCQATTRVARAIETLQLLLFRLRTGELQALPLALNAPRFDAEWKWIGSLASWRAAMFGYLYCENLLLPELKRYKSPAFADLVAKLRATRRLTPAQACDAARGYAAYLRDVCSLIVEATCQTKTAIYGEGSCAAPAIDERPLLYLFGRTPAGTIYSSAVDPRDRSGYGQRPWRTWPHGEIALKICGAAPYCPDARRRHIYVFFVRRGLLSATPGTPHYPTDVRISFARFDVNRQSWDGVVDLPDPPSLIKFAMRVIAAQGQTELVPPKLAMWPTADNNRATILVRPLNDAGDGWAPPPKAGEDEWEQFRWKLHNPQVSPGVHQATGKLVPIGDYHAVLRDRWDRDYGNGDHYLTAQGGLYRWYGDRLNGKEWLGLIALGSADKITPQKDYEELVSLAFFRDATSRQPVCARTQYNQRIGIPNRGVLGRHATLANLARAIPNWGAAPATDARLAYVSKEAGGERVYYTRLGAAPDGLAGGRRSLALPALTNNEPLRVAMPGQDPDQQRQHEQLAYQANADAAPAILALLDEAFFLVPMYIGSRLAASGEQGAALDWFQTVYRHGAPKGQRKIYHGLVREESLSALYQRPPEWLTDPLDPHGVARTRRNAFTRFTLLTIARCLLDLADAEFTRDTAESLPRARQLYTTALDLLDSDELRQRLDGCAELIGQLEIPLEGPLLQAAAGQTKAKLGRVGDLATLASIVATVRATAAGGAGAETSLGQARSLATLAEARTIPTTLVEAAVIAPVAATARQHLALQSDATLGRALERVGQTAAIDFRERVADVAGVTSDRLVRERIDLPWLIGPGMPGAQGIPDVDGFHFLPAFNYPSVTFCIPPNPVVRGLRLRAALNLHKLRTCRNIAGLRREVEPYAAPTDTVTGLPFAVDGRIALPGVAEFRPTMYRYAVLVERAKQIAQLAGQIESAMLSALEKRDAESYALLRAQQDVQLSASNVRLGALRVTEAQAGVRLAELQRERAEFQEETYQGWIEDGLNGFEEKMIAAFMQGAEWSSQAAYYDAGVAMGQAAASAGLTGGGGAAMAVVMAQLRAMAQIRAIGQEAKARVAEVHASFERRKQEWELARALSQLDIRLADQEKNIAEDHVRVVEQERAVAEQEAEFARVGADFLANKFTNAELFDWMSRILEGVHAFFLQQATSVAILAENQLAFERQEPRRGYIQDDYWSVPAAEADFNTPAPDRKGLTGSARLLQDLYQLDQHAFDTNRRKLQVSKTTSLARLSPAEFQRFRETGVLRFATPMQLFDRDFPGHYLRLIRRVRVSVIALIPPAEGIHATLACGGVSRVVIGPDVFQTTTLRRGPEMVALSAPLNATGLFDLDPPPAEMYLPFEGLGVDTSWEFRLPRPANQLDYTTVMDVLVTIDHTALHSDVYREQVIRQLPPVLRADRPFSFRRDFADAWYDLHNPELLEVDKQMVVSVGIGREDFPPNLDRFAIEQVLLYVARSDGLTEELPIGHLTLAPPAGTRPLGGAALTVGGFASTRRGNAGSWVEMIGHAPFGAWELSLRTGDPVRDRQIQGWFKDEHIEEILLVISYAAQLPPWPA